jgi:hypothetical protein
VALGKLGYVMMTLLLSGLIYMQKSPNTLVMKCVFHVTFLCAKCMLLFVEAYVIIRLKKCRVEVLGSSLV